MFGGLPASVVGGGPDLDGDGCSDSWIISGDLAYMNEIVNNDYHNRLPIGEVVMNFSFIALKK